MNIQSINIMTKDKTLCRLKVWHDLGRSTVSVFGTVACQSERSRRLAQGNALILSIMMMMTLGLLALNKVNQYLDSALALTRSEQGYWVAWELAASSLNWGLSRSWEPFTAGGWQCATYAEPVTEAGASRQRLTSCVKPAELVDLYILRGEGQDKRGTLPVFLYQRAIRQAGEGERLRFKALDNGWLDFCPFRDELQCQEEQSGE